MKILITCGHPFSGYQHVFDSLVGHGLIPAAPSRRESLTAVALEQKILQAHGMGAQASGCLFSPASLPATVLEPGKLWQELAIDLFVGNLESPQWGWSSSYSPWLLDFWKSLDNNVRFALVYTSPAAAVGALLDSGQYDPASPQALQQALSSYQACNAQLLRFYSRNKDRCVLVNSQAALATPAALLDKLAKVVQVHLQSQSNASDADHGGAAPLHALATLLGRQVVQGHEGLHTLYQELESLADLPIESGEQILNAQPHDQALAEYVGVLQKAQKPEEKLELQSQLDQVARAHAETLEKLEHLAHTHQALEAENALKIEARQSDLKSARATPALQASVNTSELEEENELLLTQLHQVQEELERYFLKSQELQAQLGAGKAPPLAYSYWAKYHPSDMLIDLREPVTGDNWYPPEADGSWAGPATTSTLCLPALRQGYYDVVIDVVDAMSAEIIEGMTLSLGDVVLELKKEIDGHAAIVRAALDATTLPPLQDWPLRFGFPQAISPAERGADDMRHLTVRIRSIKIKIVR